MDDFTLYLMLSLIFPIILLLGIIITKMFKNKQLPDNNYTPLDYILGQTQVVFHDEKQDKQEEQDQGDDKNKNMQKKKSGK